MKVLDGHGGHFAADWVKDHLLEVRKGKLELKNWLKIAKKKRIENVLQALERRIRQLKLLTSTGGRSKDKKKV